MLWDKTQWDLNESNDYFEPRGNIIGEEKFIRPIWTSTRVWFSSNYQKRVAADLGIDIFLWKEIIGGNGTMILKQGLTTNQYF